ncbi:unnamed protein product [Parajaminaea phylloscopi]
MVDIPLSSDALDLALHPREGTDLLAVGLISGKVQLVDYAAFRSESEVSSASGGRAKPKKKRTKRAGKDSANTSSSADEDEDEELGDGRASAQYSKKWSTRVKNKSCRGIDFSHDGSRIWCLSKDRTIYSLDTESGSVVESFPGAHEAAPSRLLPLPTEPNLLVTGDDDGVVKLWDTRLAGGSGSSSGQKASKAVRSYDHHFDWITDFHYAPHLIPPRLSKAQREKKEAEEKRRLDKKRKKNLGRKPQSRDAASGSDSESDAADAVPKGSGRERLVCTSGDGSLSVIDFRAPRAGGGGGGADTQQPGQPAPGVEVSEDQEDELLSIAPVRRGNKLVVGTQLGMLSLWAPSRGLLDHVDRIPGHPASVDCLLPLDESTVLSGSSDGLIRVVQILPHKFLGVVADHGMGLPVERMKSKGGILVSCGHGSEVKVTDISSLFDDDDDENDDDEAGEDAEQLARRIGAAGQNSDEDDEDDDEEDAEDDDQGGHERQAAGPSDEDEDDDEDDGANGDSDDDAQSRPRRGVAPSKSRGSRETVIPATAHSTGGDFFADL